MSRRRVHWVAMHLTDVLLLQVKSTWDENLYTTRLDPTKIGISRDEADRLAREIEGSVAANRHLAEERNQSRDTGEEVSSPATFSSFPQFLILLLTFMHLMPASFLKSRELFIVVLFNNIYCILSRLTPASAADERGGAVLICGERRCWIRGRQQQARCSQQRHLRGGRGWRSGC